MSFSGSAFLTGLAAIGALAKVVPPTHILFGTDFPFGVSANDVKSLQATDLGAPELARIFTTNAQALLAKQ